jgi:pullulanase/glycogen debranching enzyme
MKIPVLTFLIFVSSRVLAQTITLNPTIAPALFHYNDPITVTYDVTGTSMASLTSAYVWVWIPGNTAINAIYNIDPATAAASPAMCTKSTANGKTLFTISFIPANFFSSNISTQTQMGILLKGPSWPSDTPSYPQTSDYISNFLIGSNFQVTLTSPSQQPLFVTNGSSIPVEATASAASDFSLYANNQLLNSQAAITNYSYMLTVSDSVKFYQAFLVIQSGSGIDTLSFSYLISQPSPALARPQGIIDGINYNASDQTKITLCFWAPNKTSVYAFGDFTKWNVTPTYLMNQDGEHFWVEVAGLTPGTEYAFQYLVNDTLKIADPYTDKILDTQDTGIPATTYPALKQFPAKAVNSEDYYNRLSIIQTDQTPYVWQTTNYQKPVKENLVIYELLIRDFFDSSHRNYQTLIDTIGYFKKLGVNAIELMPIAEFTGNNSWGYNPTFMFAPDKYYGTKDKLKEFVDKCHANGIAVIMDMVLNQQDIPNSYAMLEYNFSVGKPKASNLWFNVDAPHPYSVFNDLNHESTYTRAYVDTILYYWTNQYKMDGFRFDLSKGFTQFNSGGVNGNVTLWSEYDQSRVNNLERMMDKLWSYSPSTYVILEHFAVNSEEQVLAQYRTGSGENLGAMLWEDYNSQYNQATMGYASNSDFSGIYYGNSGWTVPHSVGYMESHDEERLMYNNENSGNVLGGYSAKVLDTALVRMKAANVVFYTIPGPKMLWEFGELGYDYSINTCVNLTVNDSCRLTPKPVEWSYLQDPNRKALHDHIVDLIRLRKTYGVFTSGNANIQSSAASLVKQITIQNTPYTATPKDSTQMNVQIVTNFDMVPQTVSISFPHAGTWYDYYNGGAAITVPANGFSLSMTHGMYKLYTDVPIKTKAAVVTQIKAAVDNEVSVYPNPTSGQFKVETIQNIINVQAVSITGARMTPRQIDETTWDASNFSPGLYIIEIMTDSGTARKKLIRN